MLPFDELNVMYAEGKQRSISIDRFFDEMDLPFDEKEERKEFAEKLEDKLFALMAFLYILFERKLFDNANTAKRRLERELLELVGEYTYPDIQEEDYIRQYADEFVESTIRNSLKYESDERKFAYWYSKDRARFNAENETNAIFNYEQYRQAKQDGYTQKRWITMRDERVRLTHAEVDGMTIPIDELFVVGEDLMMYPHDMSASPEETCGCRCSIQYF